MWNWLLCKALYGLAALPDIDYDENLFIFFHHVFNSVSVYKNFSTQIE
mgnify:CR=1 FL=1